MKRLVTYASLLTAAALVLSACAPSLSPLYRDFEAGRADSAAALDARITSALQEAGWDTVATNVPNAVATEEKVLSNWGIYKVTASLEVTPLGRDHVRVYVHPYRQYLFGGKGKIPYLTRRVRVKFLPELNEAFEKHGLALSGTPFERDQIRMR